MTSRSGSSPDEKTPSGLAAKPHRAFFGRVAGKRLHRGQQALMDSLLPRIRIDLPVRDETGFHPAMALRPERTCLEIGYGGGEHLARLARQNPQTHYIGSEVFTGGIGKMLQKIEQEKLNNISLFCRDALELLRALPDDYLDGAFLLYPDPWPKTRHRKRRFISPVTLDALARTLAPGATFRFATDIKDYANWTLAHMIAHPRFEWVMGTEPGFWHQPFAGWEPTRYEIKARRQGRQKSWYFTFRRHA